MQIATSRALEMLNEFHKESLSSGRAGMEPIPVIRSEDKKIISLDDS